MCIREDCFAYRHRKKDCTALKELECEGCNFYKLKGTECDSCQNKGQISCKNCRGTNRVLKCKYNMKKKCTPECKYINTCSMMKDKNRRSRIFEEAKARESSGQKNINR